MIIEFILDAFATVVLIPLSGLPTGDPLAIGSIEPIVSGALMFNAGLPISEMIQGTGIILLVTGWSLAFALLRQLWRFVPVIGGG